MGYWLLLFIFVCLAIVFIDNYFDSLYNKLAYYILLALTVLVAGYWGYQDHRRHTLVSYEILPSYMRLNYLSGKTEHIDYQSIENIKFFVIGKQGAKCGLSFYIKGKDNLRTLSNFNCRDIARLQSQINQKIKEN